MTNNSNLLMLKSIPWWHLALSTCDLFSQKIVLMLVCRIMSNHNSIRRFSSCLLRLGIIIFMIHNNKYLRIPSFWRENLKCIITVGSGEAEVI